MQFITVSVSRAIKTSAQPSEVMHVCVRDNETRTLPALYVSEVVPAVRVGVSSLADLAGRQKSLISGKLAAER